MAAAGKMGQGPQTADMMRPTKPICLLCKLKSLAVLQLTNLHMPQLVKSAEGPGATTSQVSKHLVPSVKFQPEACVKWPAILSAQQQMCMASGLEVSGAAFVVNLFPSR